MSTEQNPHETAIPGEEPDLEAEPIQQMDIEEDEEDENSVEFKANNDNKLIKSSMTESYSEILNSPSDETHDNNAEHGKQIEIPKKRASSLHRNPSSQCKC